MCGHFNDNLRKIYICRTKEKYFLFLSYNLFLTRSRNKKQITVKIKPGVTNSFKAREVITS